MAKTQPNGIAQYTTTERDSLTDVPTDEYIIYNKTDGEFQNRVSSSWVNAISGSSTVDPDMAIVVDQKAASTYGGGFTSGAWQTRDLNTIDYEKDSSSWFSLSSNQITLTAGKYLIESSAPAVEVQGHQSRLWNITDGSLIATGSTEVSFSTETSRSLASGILDIAGTKVIELQHRCTNTVGTIGFGWFIAWDVNVYSMVKVTKLS